MEVVRGLIFVPFVIVAVWFFDVRGAVAANIAAGCDRLLARPQSDRSGMRTVRDCRVRPGCAL